MSLHTLRAWKQRFEDQGPAGLDDKPQGRPLGSRLPEATKRAILMMKEQHADWGQDRIAAMLLRSHGFSASASAIGRVLEEAGYVAPPPPSQPHGQEPKHFERARPNQLWQTDLFTFVLKRENRRVHLVGFLDDHSRFLVGYGLQATASGALVRESFLAAVANYGSPQEVLTDNGTQYVTWRGKSEFSRMLEQRGIQHIVATPRHPETLGKTERTLCVNAWKRRSSAGSTTRVAASGCSSATKTSSGRTAGSAAWCRRTASLRRHRRCWRR